MCAWKKKREGGVDAHTEETDTYQTHNAHTEETGSSVDGKEKTVPLHVTAARLSPQGDACFSLSQCWCL